MNSGPVCGIPPGQPLSEIPTQSLKQLLKQFGRNGGSCLEREVEVQQELARRNDAR